MNSYQIKIGTLMTFNGDDIQSIDETNSVSIVGDTLAIDELDARVFFNQVNGTTFSDIPRATPIEIYINNKFYSRYYFSKAERISNVLYKITAISGLGLIENKKHKGGLWLPEDDVYFVDLIGEIVGGNVGDLNNEGLYPITGGAFDCYVEEKVGNQVISGHLPYASARDNLHWLMISYGANLTKTASGDVLFSYLVKSNNPDSIDDDLIYAEGSVVIDNPKTMVQVEEHTFIGRDTDEVVTPFDTSKTGEVDHSLIIFSEPYHDITSNGLTIHESNCNYAIVSGVGSITGKKYTHSTRILTKGTENPDSEDYIASCSGVELINPLNSANVVDRLYSYYTEAVLVKSSFVLDSEKCGRQYSFKDINKVQRNGFIEKLSTSASAIVKATTEIITGYTPQGQGNEYSHCEVVSENKTWTVPNGITKIKVIIVGAGDGADGAFDGNRGGTNAWLSKPSNTSAGSVTGASGGAGGLGSAKTNGGKINIKTLTVNAGDSFLCQIGVGGSAGEKNGGKGGSGTPSIFGTYSSNDGTIMTDGFINAFTGEVYGECGHLDGIAGGKGGDCSRGTCSPSLLKNGESVTYNGVTYQGGSTWSYNTARGTARYYGAGWGGAYGVSSPTNSYTKAQSHPLLTGYGHGCNGANGGSGGGAGGFTIRNTNTNPEDGVGTGAYGGECSDAQSGGNGCIAIFY